MVDAAETHDEGHDDETQGATEGRILHIPPRTKSLWEPPSLAVSCVLKRYVSDGSQEKCIYYDEHSSIWIERFPVPLTKEWVVQKWGSGKYRLYYAQSDGTAAGQGPPIELEQADRPSMPARSGGPRVRERPAVAPAPVAPPLPVSGLPKPPTLPRGLDANAVMELSAFFEERAHTLVQHRMQGMDTYYMQRLATEQAARQRELEDQEMRHRRERQDDDARHARYLQEREQTFEHQLKLATARSGTVQLREELDDLREELAERGAPAEEQGFVMSVLKPILASEEGRAKLVQVAATIATAIATKGQGVPPQTG